MAAPSDMKAYYESAPKPPGPKATDDEKAAYEKQKTDFEKVAGPPPKLTPIPPNVPGVGMPAARLSDITAHGGAIILGWPTVLIEGCPPLESLICTFARW